MPGASQAAVTPAGVRDGDPNALTALIDRRGAAVLAYCQAVCARDDAPVAAAEAFARFRAAVGAADDPDGLNPEPLLLGATRHAAAALAKVPEGGVLRGRRRARQDETCADVPMLLASRADDLLGPEELDRLADHLDHCHACRQVEAAFRRAERAYRSPPDRPLPAEVHRELLVALAGAAPLVAPGSEALEGLLNGTAPELDEPAVFIEAEPEVLHANEPLAAVESPAAEAEPIADEPPAAEPEPLPAAEPLELADPPTAVFTAVPETAAEPQPLDTERPGPPAGLPAHRAGGFPRTRRHIHLPHPHLGDHGPVFRYVLPATAIALAIVIILAISGVLGGGGPAPSPSSPSAVAIALFTR